MKDGSSLVVTPSSIPIFGTRGPDDALSFEESEDILEDPDDEPILGWRISESEEEEFMIMCYLYSFFFFFFFFSFAKFTLPFLSICPFLSFAEPFEGLGFATDVEVSAAAIPAAPTAPIPAVSFAPASAVFITSVSTVPSVPVFVLPTVPLIIGPGKLSFPLFLSSFFFRGFVFSLFFFFF